MELIKDVCGFFVMKSESVYFEFVIVFVVYVYEFILVEGYMINLMIGE